MKKIIFSNFTKTIMMIVCIISILFAVNIGLELEQEWKNYDEIIYQQEDYFKDSKYLNNKLNENFDKLEYVVLYGLINDDFDIKAYLNKNIKDSVAEYSLLIDEKEYTNMALNSKKHEHYFLIHIDKDGKVVTNEEIIDTIMIHHEAIKHHDIRIYVGLSTQFVNDSKMLWVQQKDLVFENVQQMMVMMLISILTMIYLVLTTGTNKEGKTKDYTMDKLYIEFNIGISFAFFVFTLWCGRKLIEQYMYNNLLYDGLRVMILVIVFVDSVLLLSSLLSLARVIKRHELSKRSLIARMLHFIYKCLKLFYKEVKMIYVHYSNLVILILLFIYTCLIAGLGYQSFFSNTYIWIGAVLLIIVAYYVMKYLNALSSIKENAYQIKNGNLQIEMKPISFQDLNALQNNINEISNGLQVAVEKTIKAERLKTELITNVSHDLKTPLTSIISYTKLLSKVENLPEEAQDYIAIIDKKSERLKVLTQDLFDIAKVQSGNEEIQLEKINVEVLLSQTLAEYEKELEGMIICTKIEKDLFILSDGKKLSRALHNLLSNIKKYTLSNTRAFILAYQQNDQVIIEMKNIASYMIDFDKDEIMQRFKRGDESRSEEGNGLGLAIVKSYVEATGGNFDIEIDGDLFKAIIKYSRIIA